MATSFDCSICRREWLFLVHAVLVSGCILARTWHKTSILFLYWDVSVSEKQGIWELGRSLVLPCLLDLNSQRRQIEENWLVAYPSLGRILIFPFPWKAIGL